jgi:hypothetical protein
MRAINEILQGNEQTLFYRVLLHLQMADCSPRYLREFEKKRRPSDRQAY